MSRTTNARIAGFTFLFYIAVGVASMVLSGQATGAAGTAKLAGIAQHALQIRLTVVLGLLSMMSALMLGVTLYSLTRDQDPELALLAL
jgi:Na+-driven multidrug efflux pump